VTFTLFTVLDSRNNANPWLHSWLHFLFQNLTMELGFQASVGKWEVGLHFVLIF